MHPDYEKAKDMTADMFDMNKNINGFLKHMMSLYLLIMLCIIPAAAVAADWEIAIKVQSGASYNKIVIGADSTATDGFDAIWDTYALMGGKVKAYLPHPEWGLHHKEFHRDIRAHNSTTPIEWPLTVTSSLSNSVFIISWNLAGVPQDYPAVFTDQSTGQQTDMRSAGSYSFTYNEARSFTVRVTEMCSNLPVRIARAVPVYFSSLQDAYNSAVSGDTIESRAEVITGDLNVNLNKSVTLTGGYNCDYTRVTGSTTINGTLNLSSGSASIENIIIQ